MKIWITGAGGFVGRRVAEALTEKGHDIVRLIRNRDDSSGNAIALDLASRQAPQTLLDGAERLGPPEIIVHLASCQPGKKSAGTFIRDNVLTTGNLMDAAARLPVRRVIFTSSINVYGSAAREGIDESVCPMPETLYAAMKLASEQVIRTAPGGFKVILLRLASIYGKGQRDSFIDGLAREAIAHRPISLFAGGRIIRDAVHVLDVQSALEKALSEQLRDRVSVFNIGCGERHTTLDFVTRLTDALKSESPVELEETAAPGYRSFYADISSARQALGYAPMSLEESMEVYANELCP